MPGICLSVTVKFPLAAVRKRRRSKCIMRGWREDFPSHAGTIVAEKPYPQPGPVMTPGQGGSYYGKEFLPLDGDLF